MNYISKYFQCFLNENQIKEYNTIKENRKEYIKNNDPGPWTNQDICSFAEAKKSYPELHEWYLKKSRLDGYILETSKKIAKLEFSALECAEKTICSPGNIITDFYSKMNNKFMIIEKENRDHYLLYNMDNKKEYTVHWKTIVKKYKSSEISKQENINA